MRPSLPERGNMKSRLFSTILFGALAAGQFVFAQSILARNGVEALALQAILETSQSGGYAHPELLVESTWVALHTADTDFRIVDMRPAAAYAAAHIPGAVHLEEGPLRNEEDRFTYL